VEVPKKLSVEQEDLLRKFAQTEGKDTSSESASFFERLKRQFGGNG
jgi:DnaJ-class molecular chaperone